MRVPVGRPWDHLGAPSATDLRKPQKKNFPWPCFWLHIWPMWLFFWWSVSACFLHLSLAMVLVPRAPVGLNFEGPLAQFCRHSEQMWKSVNYDSTRERTRKWSIGGLASQLVLSFVRACFHDLSFSGFLSQLWNIWRIWVSAWAPFLTNKCNKFEQCFSMSFLSNRRNQSGPEVRASVAHLR